MQNSYNEASSPKKKLSENTKENNSSNQKLRSEARNKRRALSNLQQQLASKRCLKKISKHPIFLKAKHIAFYNAIDGELNVDLLINKAQTLKKQCYLPSITKKSQNLSFYKIEKNEILKKRLFGIPEPSKRKSLHRRRIDLVIMPLLAFDTKGNRLGMGGGYYDVSFQHVVKPALNKTKLIAVAHNCQQVDAIKVESWDIKPKYIFSF